MLFPIYIFKIVKSLSSRKENHVHLNRSSWLERGRQIFIAMSLTTFYQHFSNFSWISWQFRIQKNTFLLFVICRVLQSQPIIMCCGTTVNLMQTKFKSWLTIFATYTHDVKEVLVIPHLHIMPIWQLLEEGNTIMHWLRTRQTKSPLKWSKNI